MLVYLSKYRGWCLKIGSCQWKCCAKSMNIALRSFAFSEKAFAFFAEFCTWWEYLRERFLHKPVIKMCRWTLEQKIRVQTKKIKIGLRCRVLAQLWGGTQNIWKIASWCHKDSNASKGNEFHFFLALNCGVAGLEAKTQTKRNKLEYDNN